MKIRCGFVSNSSSSSFVFIVDEKLNKADDLDKWIESDSYSDRDEETVKNGNEILEYINKNKVPDNIKNKIRDFINNRLLDVNDAYLWDDDEKIRTEFIEHEDVLKQFKKAFERGAGKKMEIIYDEDFDDYYPSENIEHRNIYEYPNWKDELIQRKGYIYSTLKYNISREISDFDIKESVPRTIYNALDYDYRAVCDTNVKKAIKLLIDTLTNEVCDMILDMFKDKDYHAYYVSWCTDDGESCKEEYYLRSRDAYEDFLWFFERNNS